MPRRKATWALLIFNVLMLIWLIAGIASASGHATNCGVLDQATCDAARNVGTGIGATVIILIWFMGFVVLGIIVLATRPHRRLCPACGTEAKRGATQCQKCGFNFAAAAQSGGYTSAGTYSQPPPAAPPPPAPPPPGS
jgi:hypothetical protein